MYPLMRPQQLGNDGLVLYLPCDEGTGRKVYDASGKGNTGTLVNGVSWGVGAKGNGFGLGFEKITSTNVVNVGIGAALSGATNFSVSAIVSTVYAGVEPDGQEIVTQRDASGYQGTYRFIVSGGVVWFNIYNSAFQWGAAWDGLKSINYINDGQPHTIVAVRDGNNGYIYIDGRLDASASGTNRSLSPRIVYIGRNERDNKGNFRGVMDDVRIYNRALKAQEIKRLYEQPRF